MKKALITLLIVLVVLGVLIGLASYFGWGFFASQNGSPTYSEQVGTNGQVTSLPTDPNDVSDAALNEDAAAVDVQLQNLDADVQNVSAAVADAPIVQ